MSASLPSNKQEEKFFSLLIAAAKKAVKLIFKEIHPNRQELQLLLKNGKRIRAAIIGAATNMARTILAEALLENSSGYEFARLTLGRDFITPEEIMKARRGVEYTPEQLKEFERTLPSRAEIQWCKDNGYMLVAGPNQPLSLLEIRDLDAKLFCIKSGGWYAESNQLFSRDDKVAVAWLAIRKDAVPNSFSKDWSEQQKLISELEYVPNVAEVVWAVTVYKAERGVCLLSNFYVRTSSVDVEGDRVVVSYLNAGGWYVYYYSDCNRRVNLGVASARKLILKT